MRRSFGSPPKTESLASGPGVFRSGSVVHVGRPTTKDELLTVATHEFEKLWIAVGEVDDDDRERPGACDDWSVKDLLAHLDAWHDMFLKWEAVGSTGGQPKIPAPGYTFADTPALNAAIQQRCSDHTWADVEARLRRSHGQVIGVITSYSPDDLFTKKRFGWTGSTSVASYAISASSSHYAWASKLVRRWAKATKATAAER